ncbi:hypothetical protein HK096_007258, partial [Nowakowskiella sp. JEL0078]
MFFSKLSKLNFSYIISDREFERNSFSGISNSDSEFESFSVTGYSLVGGLKLIADCISPLVLSLDFIELAEISKTNQC